MKKEKMTRKNPNGTYRLLGNEAGSIRMEWQQEQPVFFGDPVDKLGMYEELGTPEELKKLIKK